MDLSEPGGGGNPHSTVTVVCVKGAERKVTALQLCNRTGCVQGRQGDLTPSGYSLSGKGKFQGGAVPHQCSCAGEQSKEEDPHTSAGLGHRIAMGQRGAHVCCCCSGATRLL